MKKIQNSIMHIAAMGITLGVTISSCTNSELSEQAIMAAGENANPTENPVEPEYSYESLFIPGVAVVQLSEDMARRIEQAVPVGEAAAYPSELKDIAEELGITSMERVFPYAGEYEPRTRAEGLHRYYFIEFGKEISLEKARAMLESTDGIDYFEPQHKCKLMDINDPGFSSLWALNSTANAKTHINVEKVWEKTMGSPDVMVCVVDEGIQLDHEDLKWNVDASNNYNFVKNNKTITAGDHGTHVSGTIAGVGNNGIGVVGIAGGDYKAGKRGVTLVSAEVFEGDYSARSFASAIKWGADRGAVISQNSWGNYYDWNDNGRLDPNELEYALNDQIDKTTKDAVDYFIKYAGCDNTGNQRPDSPMKGGIVVFAAGNDGIENGVPASYEPIIAVGATNKGGSLTDYSNYGQWVDICAPGSSIYSTFTKNKYSTISGTSMACPHVSGSLALLLSFFGRQGFTNEDLIDILLTPARRDFIKSYTSGGVEHKPAPYLDVWESMCYGIAKFNREYNNDPVIETEYEGDYIFRHWQSIDIPISIYDPDNDHISVETDIEGSAVLEKDPAIDTLYHFTLDCRQINNYNPKKVTITVTDMFGAKAVKEFSYQVHENVDPVVKNVPADIIIPEKSTTTTIGIADAFYDEDGEPLSYEVSVTNGGVVKAEISGSTVTLTTVGTGRTDVKLTAKDHRKIHDATASFGVLIRQNDKPVDFYPNPVRDILHIRTGIEESNVDVTISSLSGAKVFDETVRCSAFKPGEIDMKGFAPGEYKLSMVMGGKEYSSIIVKQ